MVVLRPVLPSWRRRGERRVAANRVRPRRGEKICRTLRQEFSNEAVEGSPGRRPCAGHDAASAISTRSTRESDAFNNLSQSQASARDRRAATWRRTVKPLSCLE